MSNKVIVPLDELLNTNNTAVDVPTYDVRDLIFDKGF